MIKDIRGGRRPGRCLLLLAAVGLFSSCANQQQYQDSVALAKQYQMERDDLDLQLARMQEQMRELEAQLTDESIRSLEASFHRGAEEKLRLLEQQIGELGRPLEDIERFDVEGGYIFMIQDKLLFESGKADLGDEGAAELDKISAEIGAMPHGVIWVRGHTDSDRVAKPETLERFPYGNIQLSASRAVAVAARMAMSTGIDDSRIRIMGFGPHEPLYPNDSADNKRRNRRVEIFISDAE